MSAQRSTGRRELNHAKLDEATRVVDLAWEELPASHRGLLESIGASQRLVVDRPLGNAVNELRQSAGVRRLGDAAIKRLDKSLGVWIADLRLVVIDAGHEKHRMLDRTSYEIALARIAWHEWGHALSIDRSTSSDIACGPRLLERAPKGVAGIIRGAGYRRHELIHELVAETYALLMARLRRGETRQPKWLDDEIWDLMRRVTEWTP